MNSINNELYHIRLVNILKNIFYSFKNINFLYQRNFINLGEFSVGKISRRVCVFLYNLTGWRKRIVDLA